MLSYAGNAPAEQYFEDLTAYLPASSAATKAVAHTLIQYELYRAYRLAEQQHCRNGWILMGTLVHKDGPYKQEWLAVSTGEAAWSFNTRRKLKAWTCAVRPYVYLNSVRTYLPEWISIRYLTASEINTSLTLASAN